MNEVVEVKEKAYKEKVFIPIKEIGWISDAEKCLIEGWIKTHNLTAALREVEVHTGRVISFNAARKFFKNGWVGEAIKRIEEKRLKAEGYTFEDWFVDGYDSMGRDDGKIKEEKDVQIWKELGKSKRFTGADSVVQINQAIDFRQSDGSR